MEANDPRHGTTRGHYAGCRCQPCREAINRYEKAGRVRRHAGEAWQVPAIGSQRRIRALLRLGWTSTDIADACGWHSRNSVSRVLHGQDRRPCSWVLRRTHDTIARAFEELAMTVPPAAPHRARTRALAVRNGFPPPLAWNDIDNDAHPIGYDRAGQTRSTTVDPIVVERILSGDFTLASGTNHLEKLEVVARWTGADNDLERKTLWNVSRLRRETQEAS